MRKIFEFGGFIAGAVLIIFGVAVIALGVSGRSTVQSNLSAEKIVGSEDMTPALIKTAADEAGLVERQPPLLQCREQGDRHRAARPAASPSTCGSTRSSPRAD